MTRLQILLVLQYIAASQAEFAAIMQGDKEKAQHWLDKQEALSCELMATATDARRS